MRGWKQEVNRENLRQMKTENETQMPREKERKRQLEKGAGKRGRNQKKWHSN